VREPKQTPVPECGDSDKTASIEEERRYRPRLLSCQFVFIGPHGDPSASHQLASLWNVSPGGLGLFLTGPVGAGTLIHVQFPNTTVRDRVAKVVHCSPNEDGWLVGCQVQLPLSQAELQALQL
jgi:hypothetical protein